MLTGGASTRMGRDKAFVEVDGVAMAVRVTSALAAAGAEEVLAVGGDGDALAALGLDARPDDHLGAGPLGGVLTALRLASEEIVAVLACDLAWAAAAGVRQVVAALATGAADVAVAVDGAGRQPLHAAYRRRCRPALAARFDGGARALRPALDTLAVAEVALGDPVWLRNANRPGDLP